MAASTDDDVDLKPLLMKARQSPVNFGFALGNSAEETAFLAHRKKQPDMLEREAKKQAKSPKSCGGSLSIQGKTAVLTCNDDPPAGTAKKLRQFFDKIVGMKLKVDLARPDGTVLESDGDEEEAAEGVAVGAPEGGGDAVPEGAPPEAPPPPEVSDTLAARYDAALKKIAPAIQAALGANPALRDTLGPLIATVREAAAAGDGTAAREALARIVALVQGGAAAGGGGLSVMKLGKARIEWLSTRTEALGGIERLKTAIEADYADMPEAAQAVKGALDRLDKVIRVLNVALHEKLDVVLNAAPEARDQAAADARKTMAAFHKFVDTDPVVAALDGNDILPDLAVTAPIRQKLAEISAALG